ncbi:MAG: IS607 family transposase [Novosphingobium sp.]|nr:IS607 family transposase [Novosphingobium sp.]
MWKLLNIKETASYLNVSQDTLRKWDKSGKLIPSKTPGGHRRYDTDLLDVFIGKETKPNETNSVISCATYARVSSHEQKIKGDLDRQSLRLSEYCAKHNLPITHIIKDVGSGLNDNRNGFIRLTDLIIQGKVNTLVVEHKDRLTRFQFKFIKKMFESYGCEVIIINGIDVSDTEELATDMMSLLASFSGRFYGKRSAERRKKNNNVKSN